MPPGVDEDRRKADRRDANQWLILEQLSSFLAAQKAAEEVNTIKMCGVPIPWIVAINLIGLITVAIFSFLGLRNDFTQYKISQADRMDLVEARQMAETKRVDKMEQLLQEQYQLTRDMYRFFRSRDPKFKSEFETQSRDR